ncbi:MAG: nucleotide exchange factor GrpE [Chlorobi bacterium]|nr:nucleotide exchange factor GrpE [Chlorobiota bacterium]
MSEKKIHTEDINQKEVQQEEVEKKHVDNKKEKAADDKHKKKPQRKTHKDKKEEQIKELEKKLDEISDKHLRLQAEFDNFRRRTLKEKSELIKSAGESVIVSLLPVVDDFDRALESMKDVAEDDTAKKGMLLIFNKLQEFLKQNNVTEIDALNKEFDCELHEAITKIPASSEELKGKNVDVIQKGYKLSDKVIRFAKVVIGE